MVGAPVVTELHADNAVPLAAPVTLGVQVIDPNVLAVVSDAGIVSLESRSFTWQADIKLLPCVLAALTFALFCWFKNVGSAIEERTPRITTTIRSSTKVKPC